MNYILRKTAKLVKNISSFHFIMFHKTSFLSYTLEKKAEKFK